MADKVTHIRNVTNEQTYGAEWEDDGTSWLLTNPRHTDSLLWAMRMGTGAWSLPVLVPDPARYGFTTAVVNSDAQFLAIARRFAESYVPPAGRDE
jgi:hypothetical protein